MVQMMSSGMAGSQAKCTKEMAVKLEVEVDEEPTQNQPGPLQKRPKLNSYPQVSVSYFHGLPCAAILVLLVHLFKLVFIILFLVFFNFIVLRRLQV